MEFNKTIEAEKRLMFNKIRSLFEEHGITDEIIIKEKFDEIYFKLHQAAMEMMIYGIGAVKVSNQGNIKIIANKDLFEVGSGEE